MIEETRSRTSIQNGPERLPMNPNIRVLKQRMEDNYRQFEEGYARLSQNDPQQLRIRPNFQILKQRMEENNKQFEESYAKYHKKYDH